MKRNLLLILLFIVLSSHELFLKSDSYYFKENSPAELYLLNGTFDKSENTITRDRIIDVKVLGPDYTFLPTSKDYYDKNEVTYLKFETGKTGTYVAGISTKPRTIELNGEDFEKYLEHEGLKQISIDRKNRGISDNPAMEKYSKHVKAILQVENQKTDHYAAELGYPIEFIPLKNPYELAVNDEISFKLLFMGHPLKNQTVHVSSRTDAQNQTTDELEKKTDMQGILSFPITNAGKWYVATIFMTETEEEGLDYESNWATLTFEIE